MKKVVASNLVSINNKKNKIRQGVGFQSIYDNVEDIILYLHQRMVQFCYTSKFFFPFAHGFLVVYTYMLTIGGNVDN